MSKVKEADLHYFYKAGIFVEFMANTKDGEDAYNEMVRVGDGHAVFLRSHLKAILAQLRAAGYSVTKAPKSPFTLEQILEQMDDVLKELAA